MNRQEKIDRYQDLLHAVQTGIAWLISLENGNAEVNDDPNLCYHKHLRVGIDATKSDHGALVKLLVDKGVITDDEYIDAILAGMEREKELYEKQVSAKLRIQVTLA